MRIQTADEMVVNNRLTQVGSKFRSNPREHEAVFQCSCGGQKIIRVNAVKSGKSKSCGCLQPEVTAKRSRTHGNASVGSHTPTYNAWRSMKRRISAKPGSQDWPNYGGKGITLCYEWRDFSVFLADMGEKPLGTSIDRVNNNGNYEKSNCRWATQIQQARNTSRTTIIHLNGNEMQLLDAIETAGLNYGAVKSRLRRGWSVEHALSTPCGGKRK